MNATHYTPLGDDDYELTGDTMWVVVNGFAVWIRKTDTPAKGVLVDVFRNGEEIDAPIDTASAFVMEGD